MTIAMFDSASPWNIPADAPAVARYVDGLYVWPLAQVARFAHVPNKTITVFASNHTADILDTEMGDATAYQAAQWAAQKMTAGQRPTIYCSRIGSPGEGWPDVLAALQHLGVFTQGVDFWIADQTNEPHLVAGSVATQWTDDQNLYDESVALESWLGIAPAPVPTPPAPTPPTPEDSDMFCTDPESGKLLITNADGDLFVPEPIGDLVVGTLGQHPNWGAGNPLNPCVGITPWKDPTGAWGYSYQCRPTDGSGRFGGLNPYHFTRKGQPA